MKSKKEQQTRISPQELNIELGREVDPEEVSLLVEKIVQNWDLSLPQPEHPFLVMLGGFQGSGKTTTIETFKSTNHVLVVSPDEIRHHLFAQQYPFSEAFVRLVNATKFALIRKVLELGYSGIVDQAITPDRVEQTQQIVAQFPQYQFLTVFLNAPVEVLQQRVTERQPAPGRYKGTVAELETSMAAYTQRYGTPQPDEYDLFIDTTKHAPQEVVSVLPKKLTESLLH